MSDERDLSGCLFVLALAVTTLAVVLFSGVVPKLNKTARRVDALEAAAPEVGPPRTGEETGR